MTDKLSWLLMAIQIYVVISSAIWTAGYVGWFITIVALIGTIVLAYFELGLDDIPPPDEPSDGQT